MNLGIFLRVDFINKLKTKWDQSKFVCVGLDADFSRIPSFLKENLTVSEAIFNFNKSIIDQTAELVLAYKPQSSFYEAYGAEGLTALKKTVEYIQKNHHDIPLILDAKRGDIGSTNKGYVKAIFDDLGFDAVTVSPYLGKESLQPFLDQKEKGIIVLVKTSNPGAGEFQDLIVDGKPLYQVIAEHVKSWNTNGNLAVVVGATYPEEMKAVRKIIGDIPILVPGIGSQGGNLEAVLKNGLDSKKQGLIISSSRGIIFAPNPRETTLKLNQEIVNFLKP